MLLSIRKLPLRKGTFDEYVRLSVEGVEPFFNSMGAHMLGYWQYLPKSGEPEPACDLLLMMTEYVDRDHWAATRAPNAPTFKADPRSPAYDWNTPQGEKCLTCMAERNKLLLPPSPGVPPAEHHFLTPGYRSSGVPIVFRNGAWVQG